LYGRGALGAETAQRVRGVRVTLDVDDRVALGVDELDTSHGAVRPDAGVHLRFLDPERRGGSGHRLQIEAGADRDGGAGAGRGLEGVAAGKNPGGTLLQLG